MHQSGHSREQSMHTVQFSSMSAMTPLLRAGRSGLTCGYCRVAARLDMVLKVTPSPLRSPTPLSAGIRSPPERALKTPSPQSAGADGAAPELILSLSRGTSAWRFSALSVHLEEADDQEQQQR